MTQDAFIRRFSLALLTGSVALGCANDGKKISPTKPIQIYTPSPATKSPAPVNTTTTITPSRAPLVNGTPANVPPPVIPLQPTIPASPSIAAPTLPPTASPRIPDNALPAAPPTPPSPPEIGGSVVPPMSSPVLPPSGLK